MYSLPLALTLLSSTLTTPVQAQTALEPHQHGVARLQVVLEQQHLVVSLQAPSANLLGFEHKASSAEDLAKTRQLEVQMRDPSHLIQLPADAGCALSKVEMSSRHELTAEGEPHQHLHEPARILDQHSDMTFEYHYLCADPTSLRSAEVTLFRYFPTLERLRTEVIGETQSLQELHPGNTRLTF